MQKIYAKAAPQAHRYMIEEYHRYLNPTMYRGTKWKKLVPPGVIETDFSYEYPNYFDYVSRGPIYYAIISSVKNTVPPPSISKQQRQRTAYGWTEAKTTSW